MKDLVHAANILKTGEFQVLEQAYLNWHGACAEECEIYDLFAQYMLYGELPHWAQAFAKEVISDYNASLATNPGLFSLSSFSPRVACSKKIPTFSIN